MGMVTAMSSVAPSSSFLPCANSSLRDGCPCLRVKPHLRLRGFNYNGEKQGIKWQGGSTRRRGFCAARIRETEPGPTVEQQEAEAREDERTGSAGYKLKESAATQPVHLEMETVDDVVRPKRIAFNYGFQAKFLRTGPSVPGNVIKLAFENFGREWRVIS